VATKKDAVLDSLLSDATDSSTESKIWDGWCHFIILVL
jgi:hypothetical protein